MSVPSQTTDAAVCPICRTMGAGRYVRKEGADYYRCRSCAALFQQPLPAADVMLRYAEVEYAHGGYRAYVGAREMKIEHFRRRMASIRPRLPHGRLLDVGCSCGYFLEVAAAEGYDIHGVEFSENAIAAARPEIQSCIRRGSLDNLSNGWGTKFDVITAFDVIEHLARPLVFLSEAKGLLARGGVLVLSTPDAGHWLRMLMRSQWPMFQPIQHLTIFSRRALALALSDAGFGVVSVENAYKVLSAEYLIGQVGTVSPGVQTIVHALTRPVPRRAMRRYRSVNIGEMLAIAAGQE